VVNPEVRSLELQLERWNENESVGGAGAALLEQVRSGCDDTRFPRPRTPQGRERFEQLLSGSMPSPDADARRTRPVRALAACRQSISR
jgi:hypothetical protein